MADKGKFYMTTAIAYASGKPHIGNTYEIVLADAIARYKRQEGYDVYFQSGDFVETENDYYIVWEENYYMLNVTIDEPLLKVNGGQQVNKLPEGPKFLPYEEPKNIIINAVDGVSFEIGDDQLPVGTEVTAVKPDDYDVEAFKSAIRGLSESIEVYGISAKVDGAPAVCSGEVEVTFTVPESLPLDGLKLFTISPANGSAVDLPVTVDTEARTATAKIDFKSYYFVLCTADGVNGDINGDGRLDTGIRIPAPLSSIVFICASPFSCGRSFLSVHAAFHNK